jgi:hypothetical protein
VLPHVCWRCACVRATPRDSPAHVGLARLRASDALRCAWLHTPLHVCAQEIPHTATGKVSKLALRKAFAGYHPRSRGGPHSRL